MKACSFIITPLVFLSFLALITFSSPLTHAQNSEAVGEPIGFIEAWVLSKDRAATLTLLIPGTEEYYFFHALHYQQTGQASKFKSIMKVWMQSKDLDSPFLSNRYTMLKNRAVIIDYQHNPKESIKQLTQLLKLKLDHQRPIPAEDAQIPSALDADLISAKAFYAQATTDNPSQPYTALTAHLLIKELKKAASFDRTKRLWFLKRKFRGYFPEIPQLVLAELQHDSHPSFDKIPGTQSLLLDQLIWLEKQHPALRDQESFVDALLTRFRPGDRHYLVFHPKEKRAWLDRTWQYAKSLSPKYSSLKAHLLYHLLNDHLHSDSFPEDLFIEYIQLARPRITTTRTHTAPAKLTQDFSKITTLSTVLDDKRLVRIYLHHLLGKKKHIPALRQHFTEKHLTRIQAESQLLAGESASDWGQKLSPENFRELRDRTEVVLASANATQWSATDNVSLLLNLKNTPALSVRVFKIDPLTHLRRNDSELSVDIKLNGLVPHHEQIIQFKKTPLVRHRYQLDLPKLTGRGIWIVECISEGVSCRSLVRKGSLHLVTRNTANGQVATIFDETSTPAHPATLWLKGKAYPTDKEGNLTLPFASSARSEKVILSAPQTNDSSDQSASLASSLYLKRDKTDYTLELNAGTDREQLLARKTATLLIRPRLWNNLANTPLSTLKNATLNISATLTEGITTELSDLSIDLAVKGIIKQAITVPEDTRVINITLNGEIFHPDRNEPEKLTATASMKLNEINNFSLIAQPFLTRTTDGWQIELLGRNGEPLAHRALPCIFNRNGFVNDTKQTLRTNADGRIDLGQLDGIIRLRIEGTEFSQAFSSWLMKNDYTSPKNIQALTGEVIRIPRNITIPHIAPLSTCALYRHNGDPQTPIASMSKHLSISKGKLIIKDLPPGTYSLFSFGHFNTSIHIINGKTQGPWLTDNSQTIERINPAPLFIPTASTKDEKLTATIIGDVTKTQVIAIGTRYYQGNEAYDFLKPKTSIEPAIWNHAYLGNETLNGRTLSDEYRYILERRQAKHFAGNMLPRPGLLIYPWKQQDSDALLTSEAGGMAGIPQAMKERSSRSGGGSFGQPMSLKSSSPSFDFLAYPSVIQTDLKPAADGTLTLDLKDFPHCQTITLIAYNNNQTATRTIPLGAKKRIIRERRLDRNLDPKKHYTGTRATAILRQGATAEIKNVLDADWKAYTSLSHVYDYFYAHGKREALRDFSLLMQWSDLTDKQRLASAQLLASHEFHLFTYFKDRKWFDINIKPVLENKRHRTFMDDFLLANDLTSYLSPWRYKNLNAAEKSLLARSIPAQKEAILQDLRNRYELIKPNPEQETILFASALKQNALALRDRLGISKRELASLERADRTVHGRSYIQQQLNTIIIPLVDFENTTIEEALDFLRLRTRELSADPNESINFVIRQPNVYRDDDDALLSEDDSPVEIGQLRIKELKLRNIPIGELLQYICDATRTRYRIGTHAIEIVPLDSMEMNDIMTRTFRVPPDFMAKLSDGGMDDHDDDPFGNGGILPPRTSARELLKSSGVSFPDASSAKYIASTGTLIVRNTLNNLDLIEQLTQIISGSSLQESSEEDFDGRAPMLGAPSDKDEDPFGGDSGGLLPPAPAPAPPVQEEPEDLLTHIWSESNYYHHSNLGKQPVIKPNKFWIEFAAHSGDTPFLSARFTECTDSTASMLIALAVLDLPFAGEKPDAQIDRLSLKIKAKSPMLLFYRDTRETKKVVENSPLLVRRNFFRLGDRTRVDEQGRKVENPITGDFLSGVPYTTSFIITNPTGTPRELQVLTQIPRGAIPLSGKPATQARDIKLAAHATQRIEYNFYFPTAGTYPHFPAHVLEHGIVQATASPADQPMPIKVLDHAEKRDTRSWLAVARDGDDADILTRLTSANLQRTPLTPILWRLSNKEFYQKFIHLLRTRLHYSAEVFAYGFKHGDQHAVTTFLENSSFANRLGGDLDAPLLTLDSRQRGGWEHLEYIPLINPRQHQFQGHQLISNRQEREQYITVLKAISWKSTPSQDDLLTLTYHLFLQDRVAEALEKFALVKREQTTAKMPYDYLHCYALFYQEKPAEAASIAARWHNSPSLRWCQRFNDVTQQANEITQHSRTHQLGTKKKSNTPKPRNLDLIPADGGLAINYASIHQVTLRLYSIDLEVLFSENPFLNKQGGPQPSIQPNKTMVIDLPKGEKQHNVKLPDDLRFGNVLAMIEGDGFLRVLALDSTAHQVNRNITTKSLTITRSSDGAPLPRCYVKIYIETTDGETLFFKDGYTDLRGLFPYESHTSIAPHRIKRYAIFTSHPKLGSKVTTYR